MGTVVVLGSIIVDLVAQASRLPLPGESLIGNDFGTFLGGKGINQAVAAARQQAHVTLIGRVGTDTFGDNFFPVLSQEGIADTYVTRDEKNGTGVSVVMIGADVGQNMIMVTPRANLAVPVQIVEDALASVRKERTDKQQKEIFLCQCETNQDAYITGLRRAKAMGMTTILNAAPIPREALSGDLFALVDILIVNETEAGLLAGVAVEGPDSLATVTEKLLALGSQHLIITLGAQGAQWSTSEDGKAIHRLLPPYKVKAVDTTGAGDAFCGALAASLAAGNSMEVSLQRASATGALAASRLGAIPSLPTMQEVETLLRS